MKQAAGVRLRGTIAVPGDKSIAHRVALLASIARGKSVIERFPSGADCHRTLDVLEALGVGVERKADRVSVSGTGYFGFREPASILYAGNSGTTMRMSCGLLCAQPFDTTLRGDASLERRPMRRVIEPLGRMGAVIESSEDGTAPLIIRGGRKLKGIHYRLPVASAQVKTAILLAGLHASGETVVEEPHGSRNHTELALLRFGASVDVHNGCVRITGGDPLGSAHIRLPGDISSAAFFVVGATILPGSHLVIHEVGLNPTRSAFLDVLRSMGASITVEEEHDSATEKTGTIRVEGATLAGVDVPPEIVPGLIDEIPALAVAAAFAEGATTIRGAAELRVKESDRILALATGLRALGVDVEELPDGLRITGGGTMRPASLDGFGDHRIAMAWGIASLAVEGCQIQGKEVADISYPGFWETLDRTVA
jgi:3-phosphoshikimate 1-carboxyvinyltransferase